MDDWELNPDTQQKVADLLEKMDQHNFKQLGDYKGFKREFMQFNGFDFDCVDYAQEINIDQYIKQAN
jgi:enoyl-[acyl-carrier protein] reductase/trans-2-enoyl-CoA reductase (NAD+)